MLDGETGGDGAGENLSHQHGRRRAGVLNQFAKPC
jgi:hypothetical protein